MPFRIKELEAENLEHSQPTNTAEIRKQIQK